ncbi:IS1 family transposase, partial [Pantoea sp. UBA5035]|uniref:IS1 family transposase n=1 Tax=Pantoea sp. UBA5035 TaxID=1947035 RepID=UPI0032E50706
MTCPSYSATDGVLRNGTSPAEHKRYPCSPHSKTQTRQSTYPPSQPGTQQKLI